MPATESVTGIFLFYLNAEQQKMFASDCFSPET